MSILDKAEDEHTKWKTECAFREREIAIKEREQAVREEDLLVRKSEVARSTWRSPLVVAIFAAAVAGLSNGLVAFLNGQQGRQLEDDRAEAARILEMIKTGNPDGAAKNLSFLADSGLIADQKKLASIRNFLASRQPGQGPSLPSSSGNSLVDSGPITLNPDYVEEFGKFVNNLGLRHIRPEDILFRGYRGSSDDAVESSEQNRFPPKDVWPNISPTLRVLDEFVERYQRPIKIISAYRSPFYNRRIGGSRDSSHVRFNGVDFEVVGKGAPTDWKNLLIEMRNEGIFAGGVGVYSNFVHLDTRGTNADWDAVSDASN